MHTKPERANTAHTTTKATDYIFYAVNSKIKGNDGTPAICWGLG